MTSLGRLSPAPNTRPPDRLADLINTTPLGGRRLLAWLIMAFLALAIVWSAFAQLDQVSSASGEVIPQTKLKTVQHLEGGIVQKLYVTEGDQVKEGDTLLIVEAMKVMNQIQAPRAGTVREVLVVDAQPVEYDQPLVIIE